MYELPAPNFSPPGSAPRVSVTPRIGVFVAIWLALLGGYAAYRLLYQPTRSEAARPNIVAPKAEISPDWSRHIGNLSDAAFDSEANLRRVEDEIRRTLALTDSFVEARHLHAALASLEAVHQDMVRSRHDIEALESLLKGEKLQ
ncbi:MAG TPA: hypothetical protein VNX18_05365 [Bryobacteraceae bacterium]|jgi:hypothetical protein|nr:hypothetical protein [Bryobacteraceae bacterium]